MPTVLPYLSRPPRPPCTSVHLFYIFVCVSVTYIKILCYVMLSHLAKVYLANIQHGVVKRMNWTKNPNLHRSIHFVRCL